MNPEWKTRYEAGVEAAVRASRLAMGYFDADLQVEWKQDQSPVTIADREAEQLLRSTLLGKFPADGFLGEEYGDQPGTSGYRWIIDPIDGTRSFVRGVPIWATLVGLEHNGEIIAGVAVAPALGHVYRALRGDGCWRGERRIRVSDQADLGQSVLFYSSVKYFIKADRASVFLNLAAQTQRQRSFGDFWGFVLVAQGSGELMVDHGVHIWDVAGLLAIVEEAGGRMTDWDGQRTIHRSDVLASNGKLHEQTLRLLNRS
jgi:histidinol-phosphatase